jgi:hypothetical protein
MKKHEISASANHAEEEDHSIHSINRNLRASISRLKALDKDCAPIVIDPQHERDDGLARAIEALEQEELELAQWLFANAEYVFRETRHLDLDSPEQMYYLLGFMMGLRKSRERRSA